MKAGRTGRFCLHELLKAALAWNTAYIHKSISLITIRIYHAHTLLSQPYVSFTIMKVNPKSDLTYGAMQILVTI